MSNNVSPVDRLGLTLFFAVALHTVVILGITFNIEKPQKRQSPQRTLEIMVVHNPKPAKKPEKADFLAQTSQQGGGSEEKKVRPTTRITPPAPQKAPEPAPMSQPPPPPVEPLTRKPKQVITSRQPKQKKVRTTHKKKPVPKQRKKLTAAQLLASTNLEINRLTAQLNKKQNDYAKRPRHKYIYASTQEYKYATYLDTWRKKVERIGNLNYPDEARRRKLYGNLVLHVAIRPDGSVKEINVKKSSGHNLLDDAAIRIVQLSSPFAPFPPAIRKETDIIDIIRTWQFRNNNRLSSK